MAITSNYIHLVYSGAISTNDRWNTGIWCDGIVTTWTQAQLDTLCTNALADFNSTFWSNATSGWKAQCNSAANLSQCNAYLYSPGGTLALQSQALMTAAAGTSGTILPDFISLCASIITGKFGRSYRGRMFLPATGSGVSSGNSSSSTLVQAHADHLAAHMNNLGSGVGGALLATPVVYSRHLDVITTITRVTIDNKFDTQRGRKSRDVASAKFTHSVP
jgi:hypothetical protein